MYLLSTARAHLLLSLRPFGGRLACGFGGRGAGLQRENWLVTKVTCDLLFCPNRIISIVVFWVVAPGFGRFRFFSGLGQLVSFHFVSIKTRPSLLSFVSFHDNETHKFSCPSFGFKKKITRLDQINNTICGTPLYMSP